MALLDQDDIWYPGKLEEVNRIFMGNPDIDIVCHSQNVRTNGKITHCFKPETIKDDVYRQMLFANKFSDNIFSTSAVAFKRDIIDKIGGFSEDRNNLHFVEDYDFWLRMAREGCKFYSLDKILGECSKHEKNFSRDLDTMLSGELRVLRAHYKDYKISHILDIYLMRRRIAIVYFRVYRKYLTGRRPVKGCLCLMKAVIQDPFFYTYFIKKLINRGKRSLP
jgi:GT2 family glycosyltransferase